MQLLKLTSLAALLAALAAPAQADDVFTKCKTKLVPGSGRTTIHKPATTQRVTATIRPFVYTSKTVTAPASTLTVVTSSVSITEVPGPTDTDVVTTTPISVEVIVPTTTIVAAEVTGLLTTFKFETQTSFSTSTVYNVAAPAPTLPSRLGSRAEPTVMAQRRDVLHPRAPYKKPKQQKLGRTVVTCQKITRKHVLVTAGAPRTLRYESTTTPVTRSTTTVVFTQTTTKYPEEYTTYVEAPTSVIHVTLSTLTISSTRVFQASAAITTSTVTVPVIETATRSLAAVCQPTPGAAKKYVGNGILGINQSQEQPLGEAKEDENICCSEAALTPGALVYGYDAGGKNCYFFKLNNPTDQCVAGGADTTVNVVPGSLLSTGLLQCGSKYSPEL